MRRQKITRYVEQHLNPTYQGMTDVKRITIQKWHNTLKNTDNKANNHQFEKRKQAFNKVVVFYFSCWWNFLRTSFTSHWHSLKCTDDRHLSWFYLPSSAYSFKFFFYKVLSFFQRSPAIKIGFYKLLSISQTRISYFYNHKLKGRTATP